MQTAEVGATPDAAAVGPGRIPPLSFPARTEDDAARLLCAGGRTRLVSLDAKTDDPDPDFGSTAGAT